MVGSKSEIRPDAERLIGKFGGKKVFANLKRIDIDNPFTFLSMQMFGTGGFYAISAFDEVNSERHPLLEFRAPRSLFKGVSALRVFEEDDRYRPRYSDLLIMDYLKKHQPDAAQLNNAIKFHYIASRLYRLSYSLSTYALSVYPTDSIAQRYRLYAAELLPAFKIRGGMIGGFDKATAALPDWQKIQFGDKLEVELLRGCFLAKADIDTYAEELLKLVPAGDSVAMVRQLAELAECYARNDEPEKVVRYAKQAQAMLSRNRKLNTHINIPRFIYNTALSNAQVNNFKTSLEYLMAMQSYYPRYERKQLLNRKVELLMKKKYY
jgi:hypothetical protein